MSALVLAVTADPDLAEEVRAAGAAAGLDVRSADSLPAAAGMWSAAETVVVGSDALRTGSDLPRRARVLVVALGGLPTALWPAVVGVGAEQVLDLPRERAALLAALVAPGSDAGALVVGVVGGRGGAGASVLAARLAAAFADDGCATLALDADPDGPGLDVVLALEHAGGARWHQFVGLAEGLPPRALREALPTVGRLAVLAFDREPGPVPEVGTVQRVLDSARSAYDVVVLDLPRGREDVLAALVPRCDELLLVTTGDVVGTAAATRTLRRLGRPGRVGLVVRDVPGRELDADDVVAWLGAPLAAALPHDPRLASAVDRGLPPSGRSRWSRSVRDLATVLRSRAG